MIIWSRARCLTIGRSPTASAEALAKAEFKFIITNNQKPPIGGQKLYYIIKLILSKHAPVT